MQTSGAALQVHSATFFVFSDYGVSFGQAVIDEFDLDGDGEFNEAEFFAIMTDDS